MYVLETDLADLTKPLPSEALPPGGGVKLVLVSSSEEMTQRLLGLLARRGISFQATTHSEGHLASLDGRASVSIVGRVDDNTFRYMAKIAFNYLAWRTDAAFVRQATFMSWRAWPRASPRLETRQRVAIRAE